MTETLEQMEARLVRYEIARDNARPQNRRWMQARINTLTLAIARAKAAL